MVLINDYNKNHKYYYYDYYYYLRIIIIIIDHEIEYTSLNYIALHTFIHIYKRLD